MPGQSARENGKLGGRPKGSKSKATKEKEAVLQAFRERVMSIADDLLDSQLTLAKGQTFLYKIEKELVIGPKGGKTYRNKRPVQVTEQWEIEAYLEGLLEEGDKDNDNDPNATYYFLTVKEPNNNAIDSMLDRTFGKSVSRTELTGKDGEALIPDKGIQTKIDESINKYLNGNKGNTK